MANDDTKAAQQRMMLAREYLQEYEKTTNFYEEGEKLRLAAKNLAEARSLDPNCTIVADNQNALTLDKLSAIALFYEGQWNYRLAKDSPKNIKKTAEILEKAVTFDPQPQYLVLLAKVYAAAWQRDDALRAAKRAIEVQPDYMPALKVRDKLESNPSIGAKPSILKR